MKGLIVCLVLFLSVSVGFAAKRTDPKLDRLVETAEAQRGRGTALMCVVYHTSQKARCYVRNESGELIVVDVPYNTL